MGRFLNAILVTKVGGCKKVRSIFTNMQAPKKYNIHNNNAVNLSAKLTQTMCVNPDIVKFHWKS